MHPRGLLFRDLLPERIRRRGDDQADLGGKNRSISLQVEPTCEPQQVDRVFRIGGGDLIVHALFEIAKNLSHAVGLLGHAHRRDFERRLGPGRRDQQY